MMTMLDTLAIYEELAKTFGPDAAKALASVLEELYREVANTVTKQDFQELRSTLQELAQAQQRTEQRVEQLAEAQQRTEQRVEQLAEGQRTLVEAHARTEAEIRKLAKGLRETRQMVGGLSDAVGYGLEDRAIGSLPRILPDLAGITVEGKLSRRWVRHSGGREDELNIFGKGHHEDGRLVTILGEAKARLKKRDIDTFLKLVSRLKASDLIEGEPFLLMVSYQLRPDVEAHAKEHGVLVIPSYELNVFI